MFSFMRVASLLKTASSFVSAKDWKGAAGVAADVFELLGASATATTIRDQVDAVGEGDARSIAVHALQLIGDAVQAVFGFPVRITVSAAGDADGEPMLAAKLDQLAECCEAEGDTPKTMTAAAPVDSPLTDALLAGLVAILTAFWRKRFGG